MRRAASKLTSSVLLVSAAIILFWANNAEAAGLDVEILKLPPLRIGGQDAKAHTQGLEIVDGKYFVTARREDVRPKRPLLLSTESESARWNVWDLTPAGSSIDATGLDHPGGIQSDGKRLWIPVAESKPKSRTLIRVFSLAKITVAQPLKAEIEFAVQDHIGALAVAADRKLVLGANWDTEIVYVWDLNGVLRQTLQGDALRARGLGVGTGASGVAVQDWKIMGDLVIASGLCRATAEVNRPSTRSRVVSFTSFLQPGFQSQTLVLPLHAGIELGREAMAISNGGIYLLPEDLGSSNRIFRMPLAALQSAGR